MQAVLNSINRPLREEYREKLHAAKSHYHAMDPNMSRGAIRRMARWRVARSRSRNRSESSEGYNGFVIVNSWKQLFYKDACTRASTMSLTNADEQPSVETIGEGTVDMLSLAVQPWNGREKANIWVSCEATEQDNLEELEYEVVKKDEEPGHEDGKEEGHHDFKAHHEAGAETERFFNGGNCCLAAMLRACPWRVWRSGQERLFVRVYNHLCAI